MAIELKVPTVGESITEVLLVRWFKGEGDRAQKDEPLVEIETDKATFELPAPEAGTVTQIVKKGGEPAEIGEVIAYFEAGEGSPVTQAPVALPGAVATREALPLPRQTKPVAPVERRVDERPAGERRPDMAQPTAQAPKPEPESQTAAGAPPVGNREEDVVPMSPMRKRIAERLVQAQQSAALLTTFNEVDMSAVVALRQGHKEAFEKRYSVKLGLMSFFVKACVEALKQFPQINAEIRGTDIVYHNYFDIGIAVSGGKGLVVPILRNAERMSFAQIESTIADLAARAKESKITLEELKGGTFTITNGGVFGSLLSTPIINPPQSGILGLHAMQDRPVAREGQVVIRPMMYVALTYDHRLVDGREAVTFLRRIKEILEEPGRMLMEI
jgi:2-oxoglutarate dehydrogenase E2 component (dihydrolipoamide succinyltransferase)